MYTSTINLDRMSLLTVHALINQCYLIWASYNMLHLLLDELQCSDICRLEYLLVCGKLNVAFWKSHFALLIPITLFAVQLMSYQVSAEELMLNKVQKWYCLPLVSEMLCLCDVGLWIY